MATRQTGYTAPVMPVEWMVNPSDPQRIHPCFHCLPWHAEVVVDHPEGGVWVREWHAIGCVELAFWLHEEGM